MRNAIALEPTSVTPSSVTEFSEPTKAPKHRAFPRRAMPPLAGFIAIAVLSNGTDEILRALGVFPPLNLRMSDDLFVLATAYRFAFSIAGCALAARLASDRPMRAAYGLGAVGLALSTLGLIANWVKPEIGPLWYPAALVLMTLPCAWLGGKLGARR